MSGPLFADRVQETTTTTGTGTVTLAGAVTGYQSFAAIGNGNTCCYTIAGGAEWEVGIGTYTSSGTTLARTTVLASSNSGSLVSFSAGTKNVLCVVPAASIVDARQVVPALFTVEQCDYAGLSTQSFTNGQVATLNGRAHTFAVAAGMAAAIVAGGLQFSVPSSATNLSYAFIGGLGTSVLGDMRIRYGNWQYWAQIATNYTPTTAAYMYNRMAYNWASGVGAQFGRSRNAFGAPNTTAGGVYVEPLDGIGGATATYNLTASGDVFMMNFVNPFEIEFWLGTFGTTWPTWDSMTFVGRKSMADANRRNSNVGSLTPWDWLFGLNNTGNACDITMARWRFTVLGR